MSLTRKESHEEPVLREILRKAKEKCKCVNNGNRDEKR